MNLNLCDDCIRQLMKKISREEILLLVAMEKRKAVNAQMSLDEEELTTMVVGITTYKIKFILKRLLLVDMIDSNKFGSTKYFLTITGRKALYFFKQEVANLEASSRIKLPKPKNNA